MIHAVVAVVLLPVLWFGTLVAANELLTDGAAAVPEPDAGAECGRLLVEPDDGVVFHAASTRVVLALDEEWLARFGEDSTPLARSLLADAAALFRRADIHLLPVRIEEWRSPDDVTTARQLLPVVTTSVDRESADIVIALTAQELTGADGRAEIGGRYALVEHHVGRSDRDEFVLAHEIAHLFGATHGCDLADHEGLLASEGYEEPEVICPCTRQLLEANAARFHELAEPSETPAP